MQSSPEIHGRPAVRSRPVRRDPGIGSYVQAIPVTHRTGISAEKDNAARPHYASIIIGFENQARSA
ncbi:MAG TPA: hypothetical protein DCZ61_04565 [Lachnospiraceae bacterium]|nr:hypothetical protein [Lachnospiraceae bacterium]